MILPVGASRFEEALQWGSETYHHLKVGLFLKIYGFLGITFLFASVTLYIKARYDLLMWMAGCRY